MMRGIRPLMMALCLVCVSATAWAQPKPKPGAGAQPAPPPTAAPKPWSVGVSPDQQAAATQLFEQGLTKFENNDFGAAARSFEEALTHWDHPGIHFNLTVCLVNLDRPLEAHDHVISAMKYEKIGLDDDKYQQATTYKRLLEARLVFLEVESTQDGVEVSLDGKPLLNGKGSSKVKLLSGEHALVATKEGFETMSKNLTLSGGAMEIKEVIELSPRVKRTVLKRRWRSWVPWAFVGGGAATATLGGGFMFVARTEMDRYGSELRQACPTGCARTDIPASVSAIEDRAQLENTVGISLVAAGGAAMLTGLTMVVLNQPREVEASAPASTVVFSSDGQSHAVTWLGSF